MGPSPKKSPSKGQQQQPPVKRVKRGALLPSQKSSFEDQLRSLDDRDGETHGFTSTSIAESLGKARQPHAEKRWPRPPLADWLQQGRNDRAIKFQLVDIDYTTEKNGVVVRLFGVTDEGNSICANVPGYRPYFYAKTPLGFNAEHIPSAVQLLNANIRPNQTAKDGPSNGVVVTDIEIVHGSNLYGYHEEQNCLFLKIYLISPRLISACRSALFSLERIAEKYVGSSATFHDCKPFESNLDFEVRFMADLDLVGCGWAECPAGKYEHLTAQKRQSECQLEIRIDISDLIPRPVTVAEWSGIAPLRTLSFDIECIGPMGVFPDASRDPIIQIANMVKIEGQFEPAIRNCFLIGTCAPIVGSDIIECRDEVDLLTRWADFVRRVDPDMLTGYNIQNFDLPYIMDRAKQLKIDNKVCLLSRLRGAMCRQRETQVQSKQMGNRVNKCVSMDGRIIFDVLQVLLRDYKLRSYTLNSVSYFFLGEQKEDVAYNFIPELHNGTAVDRRRLALYCMKDAYLPLRLLDKLMLIINYMEMARVTGVPLNFLLTRGQQVKILLMLLRKTRTQGLFMPLIESGEGGDEVGYEGATVIEPVRDFYNEPIATLDFASLYPSIMIAHNLCYTTLLKKPGPGMVEGDDYIKTPSGDLFITPKHRVGLLPQVLRELLSARKRVKNELKSEADTLRQMVLSGRQLALKISANSVYGFTGASRGKLPCMEISQSVTAYGRKMIEKTKVAVESIYTRGALNGLCRTDAKVIYGDTDSVMVKFGVKSVGEAMEIGRHAAVEITKTFEKPIQLEFEKVYFPYLLINKKRYAGLYWTREECHDKMDCKGLETVRRDNCPLVPMVLNQCLDHLLLNRDKDAALKYAKGVISELLVGKIDISMLIITKELTKKGDKYAAKQAHVELAERMRKRDPGSAPRLGDRVPYVIVNKGSNVPAYEKAEDPIYVLRNNIPIDTAYYLEHQLAKPLARIFEPILGDRAEQLLTSGHHTQKKSMTKLKSGMMAGYFSKKAVCMGCKSKLDYEEDSAPATCPDCEPRAQQIYVEKVVAARQVENKFARLWTECQNCAGTMQSEVFCSSRDCPIFYMREKVRNDLEEVQRTLRRFHINNGTHRGKENAQD